MFLNANGAVNSHQKISNTEGGLTCVITNNALFGESIDGLVDIDNDAEIEIIVGVLRQDYLIFMANTGDFFGG
ncbi:hypothetical protein [Olleya sp. Bg11-27]|uniref:hypothetical protein n=1 Tax=Olleya sp. Bg11-27 TaxID=2058135 RepID=UPI000C3076DA|nr:hypothetical protein [Olleya sp. Bg11-27]AUC75488.1 hypothetical protein CW732_07270 [Olleya sp. Bg11-27]